MTKTTKAKAKATARTAEMAKKITSVTFERKDRGLMSLSDVIDLTVMMSAVGYKIRDI